MPNDDIELEEIKRLIADANPSPLPKSKELVPSQPRQAAPVMPKKPDAEIAKPAKQGAGLPALSKRPGQGQVSVRRPSQSSTPAPARKPSSPGTAVSRGGVREYDISSNGKVSKAPVSGSVREFDISSGGKVTKHRGRAIDPELDALDTGDEKFKVNFDFDGVYKDVPEDRPLKLRREKRTGCIGGIMYAAFVICVSLVFASLLWMATVDVLGFGAVDEQVSVQIPLGFTMEEVTNALYEGGLIRYRFLFNLYASFSNAEDKITAGTFILNRNFDYRALVQGMTARAGVRVETTVTIPEGFTLLQIFTLLEDYDVVHSADELWEVATNHSFNFHFLDEETLGERFRLEGFLFPDTYNFFLFSNPVTVINRFLREFDRRFTEEYVERAEEMGMSVRDIINVAAMIEREAANDVERPRIAAVIYNRLESPNFPNLEIDATLSYAVQGTDLIATTTLDHPFNTYLHPGLPPWPIANPGIASIRAALFPQDTNEFFYALHVDGTHRFFRTYPEHRAFVQSDDFGRWW